jgi:Family of unknown function (DUF6049)
MPSRCARLLLATGMLAGLTLPAALSAALPAAASPAAAAGAGLAAAKRSPAPVSIAITSVNPPYASAKVKVTVRGSLTNTSGRPLRGLTVQLRSSNVAFSQRAQLQQYASGADPAADAPQRHALTVIRRRLAPGETVSWRAVLPVAELHLTSFGVYPLAAQVSSTAGAVLGTSRTFLPYWPTGRQGRPRQSDIAWIWPLIDLPDQGPCAGLLNNNLAASVADGGRLARLLAAGTSAAGQQAQLTYAIDPALVSSVSTMTGKYATGAGHSCQPGQSHPASAAARSWLTGLRSAVAGQPAFVTPYADVDIAALTRSNLDGDVNQAFTDGRTVAGRILHHSFTPAAPADQSAQALTSATAWPADGLANYAMLGPLAGVNGIRTLVLSSSTMPPSPPVPQTPSAVTTTPNDIGGAMRVLLADSTLTHVIGSAAATAGPGAAFSAAQRFLAETAMIVGQTPVSRAIVIAPPPRWDPSAGLASGLLGDTVSAPWLDPVSAGDLAADTRATGRVARTGPNDVGSKLISRPLLRQVHAVDRDVRLVQSMTVDPVPQLNRSIAGVESAAWRVSPAQRRHARALLSNIVSYVSRQENEVSIISPGHLTLGGQKGAIPITINNKLHHSVQVRVQLTVDQPTHSGFAVLPGRGATQSQNVVTTSVIKVQPDIINTERLKVRASSIGTTTISLRLLAPDGQALPQPPVTMTVQATHFGTFALTILAAALGVFVITSATRAIRRGRTPPGPGAEASSGGDAPDASGPAGHEEAEETDNVGHDLAEPGEDGPEHVLTEDADDYAPVPGWADRS